MRCAPDKFIMNKLPWMSGTDTYYLPLHNSRLCQPNRMERNRYILASTAVLSILSACTGQDVPTGRATVSQEGGTGRCHINYLSLDRDVLCSEVAKVMLSEMHIATSARNMVAPDKVSRLDEVGRLLQLLTDSGYILIEFPSH